MDPDNLLEQFREDWKKELKHQDSLNEDSASAENDQLPLKRNHSQGTQSQTNKLHLLFESGKVLTFQTPCASDSDEPKGRSKYVGASAGRCTPEKRKNPEKDSCMSKRTKSKSSKFDDIFSEKEKGVLPQERLLDRLIQDIVSAVTELAEAIRTTVVPISILIRTTVVPIRILIRTTGM